MSYLGMEIGARVSGSVNVGIDSSPSNGFPRVLIFTVGSLEGTVTRGNAVFSAHFGASGVGGEISACVDGRADVGGVRFSAVISCVVLVTFVLGDLGYGGASVADFVASFRGLYRTFCGRIPTGVCVGVIRSGAEGGVAILGQFVGVWGRFGGFVGGLWGPYVF